MSDADSGITVGGALELAEAMQDLEPVAWPLCTKAQLGTLTAHPGDGKSTFMSGVLSHYAVARSYGPIRPEADGLCYFVSAEDFQGTRNRILAEAIRLKLGDEGRGILNARLRWVHVDTHATANEIKKAIADDARGCSVAIIFVDTGPSLFGGEDENDNVALRNYVESFNAFAQLTGSPATILAWHPSKGATADRLEPRGASAIKGSIDFNLTLWRDDDRVTLSYSKMRGEHFDPMEGRLSTVELVGASGKAFTAPVIIMEDVDKPERSDARAVREAILRQLHLERHDPPSVRALAKAIDKPPSTVGGHLTALAAAKPPLVQRDAVTERYTLTKPGEARAKEVLCPTW